ncbi:MAG: hypothetical protein Ct9H300mP1_28110 [Planctomycetaceae bacterium]|nr:MAG: hypothetical protein Ct9H300mP1_28110 [Planctomycetaceae bacterium]
MAGLAMMAWHHKSWGGQQVEPGFKQWDLKRLKVRYRRRMQTSGMIVVLGVMLAVGDAVIWSLGPLVATIYWIVVFAMGGWLLLLGVGDLLRFGSTRSWPGMNCSGSAGNGPNWRPRWKRSSARVQW